MSTSCWICEENVVMQCRVCKVERCLICQCYCEIEEGEV